MTDAPDIPQWQPTERDISDARVTDFARFVQERTEAPMTDYQSLWQWSVDDPAAFWGALWEYFELGTAPDRVLDNAEMPGARWFPGVRINYVDQIVRVGLRCQLRYQDSGSHRRQAGPQRGNVVTLVVGLASVLIAVGGHQDHRLELAQPVQ